MDVYTHTQVYSSLIQSGENGAKIHLVYVTTYHICQYAVTLPIPIYEIILDYTYINGCCY